MSENDEKGLPDVLTATIQGGQAFRLRQAARHVQDAVRRGDGSSYVMTAEDDAVTLESIGCPTGDVLMMRPALGIEADARSLSRHWSGIADLAASSLGSLDAHPAKSDLLNVLRMLRPWRSTPQDAQGRSTCDMVEIRFASPWRSGSATFLSGMPCQSGAPFGASPFPVPLSREAHRAQVEGPPDPMLPRLVANSYGTMLHLRSDAQAKGTSAGDVVVLAELETKIYAFEQPRHPPASAVETLRRLAAAQEG